VVGPVASPGPCSYNISFSHWQRPISYPNRTTRQPLKQHPVKHLHCTQAFQPSHWPFIAARRWRCPTYACSEYACHSAPYRPRRQDRPIPASNNHGHHKKIEPHYKKLKAEEEKARADLDAKQDKLRQSLQMWDKLEMESKAWKTRVDLSEQSLKSLAGEGLGGAAF